MTSTQIALECQVGIPAVLHILGSRHDIRPVHVAGQTRMYDAKAVALVKRELDDLAARRAASPGQFKKAKS